MSSHDEQYATAEASVEQRVGLAVHWLAFVAVNLGLAMANGFSGFGLTAGYLWGWGIGVVFHTVYVVADSASWRDRLVERDLQRPR